tara:strand:- start:479 stop:1129 length:651 start_codon:yes stop_codon:yes gene_type:complete
MKKIAISVLIMLAIIVSGCEGVKVCVGCKERELRTPKSEELAIKKTAIIATASVDNTIEHAEHKAINKAVKKFKQFKHRVKKKNSIVIINFDLPHTSKRMWIYDLKKNKITKRTTASHSYNSGRKYAKKFSNVPQSNLSSIGSFVTGRDFDGEHGYSLRLYGLERGINHNALKRGIIFHPKNGQTHSLGCFMLDDFEAFDLIDFMKNGTFVYVYKS